MGMATHANTLRMLTSTFDEENAVGGNDTELRDKVIRLETNFDHFQTKFAQMEAKVDQMHEIVLKARGIKWFIGAMAIIGGFLGTKFWAMMGSYLIK